MTAHIVPGGAVEILGLPGTYLPCPFCGSRDLSKTDWWDKDGEYDAVACNLCKAEAPATTWNARADANPRSNK